MNWIISILSITLLGILAFQDFRYRAISWFLLPLLLLTFFYSGLQAIDLSQFGKYFSFNFSFILLQMVVLTVYVSLKNKKFTNIVNEFIGVGDILFFVVICAAFSPSNFILFYVFSLLFSLLVVAGHRIFARGGNKEVPLAGLFSVVLLICIFISGFESQPGFYREDYALLLIEKLI